MTPQRKEALLAVQRIAFDSSRYYGLGQGKQGESRLRQALAARKVAPRPRHTRYDGPESQNVNTYRRTGYGHDALFTILLHILGILARDLEQYADAEKLLLEAVAQKQQIFGEENREVAPVIDCLASVYQVQGRYDEAEPLLLHSLAIVKLEFGPKSKQVSWTLYNLAHLYHCQGRTDEAIPLMEEAIRWLSEWLDYDDPTEESAIILADYARLLATFDLNGDSVRLEQQSREMWNTIEGLD